MTLRENFSDFGLFLYGKQAPRVDYYPDGVKSQPEPYGSVKITSGGTGVTFYVHSAGAAAAISAAFAELAGQFPPEPEPEPEPAAERAAAADAATYPVRMIVHQRDAADPESWVYLCNEPHAADCITATPGMPTPWLSLDYASEGGALIGAADHARAVHNMALPNDLAERAAAAERDAAGIGQ